jgi:hypothetical protein
MQRSSETIGAIAGALAKAQDDLLPANRGQPPQRAPDLSPKKANRNHGKMPSVTG